MALTANRELNRYVDQELRTFPVAASAHVWKGALVGVDRSSGHVRNLVAGDMFAGIAYEEADNSSGSGGDVSVRLYTQGDFVLTTNNATQVMVGTAVYAMSEEVTGVNVQQGASFCGLLMAVVGANKGIVRIMSLGGQQVEHAAHALLSSSTSAATTNPILITQRAIRLISAEVSFNTVPDQGNLDIGIDATDPDGVVNEFDLSTLTAHTPQLLTFWSRDVAKAQRIWAKVGQASSTPGAGGLLTLRYIELP